MNLVKHIIKHYEECFYGRRPSIVTNYLALSEIAQLAKNPLH